MSKAQQANQPTSTNDDSLFGEAGKVSFPYFKFENIGDKIKGVYVGKTQTTSMKYGYEQENYHLSQDDGSIIIVSGRNPNKGGVRVIYGMEKIPLGAVMGFIFASEKETNKGNAAKIIEVRYAGEKKMEVYQSFKDKFNLGVDSSESTTEAIYGEDPATSEPEF